MFMAFLQCKKHDPRLSVKRFSTKKFVFDVKKLSFDSACEHCFWITILLSLMLMLNFAVSLSACRENLRRNILFLGFLHVAFRASCRLVLDIY